MKGMKGAVNLKWVIGTLLGVVFFASVIGTMADSVASGLWVNGSAAAGTRTNVTGAAATVFTLTTLIVVIVFIAKLAGR
jgi:hypothetical protein